MTSWEERELSLALKNARLLAETLPVASVEREAARSIAEYLARLAPRGGYVEAFYEMADILGVNAPLTISPKKAYQTQMKPKLEALRYVAKLVTKLDGVLGEENAVVQLARAALIK